MVVDPNFQAVAGTCQRASCLRAHYAGGNMTSVKVEIGYRLQGTASPDLDHAHPACAAADYWDTTYLLNSQDSTASEILRIMGMGSVE